MRISDWSSDVCSSDLNCRRPVRQRTVRDGARLLRRGAGDHRREPARSPATRTRPAHPRPGPGRAGRRLLMARPPAIALMGPTASGKSALALEWAERFDGEIVSVDSALVYRGLDIGAAKPTREEQARVRHHLVDVRDPWQPYSAAEFAQDARAAEIGRAHV